VHLTGDLAAEMLMLRGRQGGRHVAHTGPRCVPRIPHTALNSPRTSTVPQKKVSDQTSSCVGSSAEPMVAPWCSATGAFTVMPDGPEMVKPLWIRTSSPEMTPPREDGPLRAPS